MYKLVFFIISIVCTHCTELIHITIPSNPGPYDKVLFLFNLFDHAPRDNYLSFQEAATFHQLTDPSLPLTIDMWKHVCIVLGSNRYRGNRYSGLDINEFNSSYYQYSEQLGTNLNKDYSIIRDLLMMQGIVISGYDVHNQHCRSF